MGTARGGVSKRAVTDMFNAVARALASLSLALKQPVSAFCEIETTNGDAIVTKTGDYLSWIRVDGMQRMANRKDIARIAEAMRVELSGALEAKGHAIVGWYISDPDAALVEIERLNLNSCRAVAREVGLGLSDILDERARLWPKLMRWEAAYYLVWTRRSVLTKEERSQLKEEVNALAKECPDIGDAQKFYLHSEILSARHTAFVLRVLSSLRAYEISAAVIDPHAAIRAMREVLYREMAGSEWKPALPGDRVMARLPEEDAKRPNKETLLWPAIRDQLFYAEANADGGQRVEIGDYDYACVDMMIGPEDPRPFVELASWLGRDRIPWRAAFVVEGGGKVAMQLKEIGASFLSIFPSNNDLRRAFANLRHAREQENHISVKLRARLCDLGAHRRNPQAAAAEIHARAAHRGLG
jgi:intracellular multiplication protein IcmB